MLSIWKIGLIRFLPKASKPDAAYANSKSCQPFTLLPTINKVIGKIIMDGVNEDVQEQMSWAQKGGVNNQPGSTEFTFRLRSIIKLHRRNKTGQCIVALDASNTHRSVEPAIMRQAIQMCCMNTAYRKLWLDINTNVKIHILSEQISMGKGVCQGGISSLITYNVFTDTLPK